MKSKKNLIGLLTVTILFLSICYFAVPNVKANGTIPPEYSDRLKLNGIYIYNVLEFGEDSNWFNFSDESEGYWATSIGDEIRVNITGFFARDPDDVIGDVFSDVTMPWFNIEIYKDTNLNFTLSNVSNGEVARNLKLGFSKFQSGFIIPYNQSAWIKANATLESGGASGKTATLTMEESYNFLYFHFEEFGSTQNQDSELIYDVNSGLLVRANTSIGDYKLTISLANYTLNIEEEYKYEVNTFEPLGWAIWTDLWGNYKDIFATSSERGYILVNFTGFYHGDPLLWDPDPFKYANGRPWLDIKIVYVGDVRTDITMQMNNISNTESANALLISFPSFLSGFLLPIINNDTYDIESEVLAASSYIADREFSYKETDLTIDMYFKCGGSFPQETRLIYEKLTGLLLYTDTIGQNYHLEITIENYDVDLGEEGPQVQIPSFSINLILSVSIITFSMIIYTFRRKIKINS